MSNFGRRVVKVPGTKSTNSHSLKMKEPTTTCSVSIYIFDWSHNFHIQIKCVRYSRCIIYHFSVSPALSKCETIFKKWGILLQRAHVRFPAKVRWLWLENTWVALGVTVWPSFISSSSLLQSFSCSRAELELTYSKGLQKLAGKLIRASKGMSNK